MVRFERSKAKKDSFSKRGPRKPSFGDNQDSRSFNRDSPRNSRNRRDFEMTKATCSSCNADCEVPFKPTSNKPLFCSDCFRKNGRNNSNDRPNNYSNKDLDVINEKLNKIMGALKIK